MENRAFRKFDEVSGNCSIAGFCTKYPRASGSLERPPNPLPYRTNPPLKISAYGPDVDRVIRSVLIWKFGLAIQASS